MQFSETFYHFITLGPNIHLSALFKTPLVYIPSLMLEKNHRKINENYSVIHCILEIAGTIHWGWLVQVVGK
jgi:hypothetical protein